MHATALHFAVKHGFRLAMRPIGGWRHYFIVNSRGVELDTPAEPYTAQGAIRMMRRRLRTIGREFDEGRVSDEE